MKKLLSVILAVVISCGVCTIAFAGETDIITDPKDIHYRFGGFGAEEYIDGEWTYVVYYDTGEKVILHEHDIENYEVTYDGPANFGDENADYGEINFSYAYNRLRPDNPRWYIANDVIFYYITKNPDNFYYGRGSLPDSYRKTFDPITGERKKPVQSNPLFPGIAENDSFDLWKSISDFFASIWNFFVNTYTSIAALFS